MKGFELGLFGNDLATETLGASIVCGPYGRVPLSASAKRSDAIFAAVAELVIAVSRQML